MTLLRQKIFKLKISSKDVVIRLSASSTTPFTSEFIKLSKKGALTIGIGIMLMASYKSFQIYHLH